MTQEEISLKHYIDARIEALRNEMHTITEAADRAIIKAETATNERLAALNELRATMQDERVTYLPRNEFNAQHGALQRQVDELRNLLAESRNRITDFLARTEGRDKGLSTIGALLYGFVIAAVAVATVILTRFK